MRSLFLKIFLWFWAIQALIFLAMYAYWSMQPETVQSRWHAATSSAVTLYGQAAAEEADRYGQAGIDNFFARLRGAAHVQGALLDEDGKVLAGTVPNEARDLIATTKSSGQPETSVKDNFAYAAVRATGPAGKTYIFVAAMPRPTPRSRQPQFEYYRWAIMIGISGIICYLLTLYLTRPILRLRDATHELSGGHLSARASAGMERRRDEIGSLVRDFNHMAERLEALVTSQQTLLRDISHELRSPLARLSVALELARQRSGPEAKGALDRMEREAERLNDLIGQLLTLTQIDTDGERITRGPVSLAHLVQEIAADANFEADRRQCRVEAVVEDELMVFGSEEMLRRAIENVVRNAVRYTASDTSVSIRAGRRPGPSGDEAVISVRDHGPGVPEGALAQLFLPFYRVADARDRQSGGTGIGLAITERAVRLHGGSVSAANAPEGGLLVTIALPLPTA